MIGNYTGLFGQGSPFAGRVGVVMFVVILVWSLAWKGFALWRAAREESPWWFGVMLVVNTLGLLEIIYLFIFSKAARQGKAVKSAEGAKDDNAR